MQNEQVLNPNDVFDDFYGFIKQTGFSPEFLSFDPSLANHYYTHFEKSGFKTQKEKYSPRSMTQSIRELERIGNGGGLSLVGENPCVLWQYSNVLVSQKSRGYCLMDRVSVHANIDAPVATALALKPLIENPKKHMLIGAFG